MQTVDYCLHAIGGKTEENLLVASFLHVMFISYDEDTDLTAMPAFPPGEQVRHQQSQTLQ